MRGRKPLEYRLREGDQQYLQALLADGLLIQRVAKRAQALLAWDRGERLGAIVHWLGWSRTGLWELGQRYQDWGVEAVFEAERSGRPRVFSLAAARAERTHRLHGPHRFWPAAGPLGLPQSARGGGRTGRRGGDP